MPRDLHVDFVSIVQPFEPNALDDEQLSGELLFFPELRSFAHTGKRLLKVQEALVREILEHAEPIALSRRLPPAEIGEDSAEVELEAPGRETWWREPLRLKLAYVHWRHHDGTRVAYIPALGIEVVASDEGRFAEQLHDDILFALNRMGVRGSLFDLAVLTRADRLEVARVTWNAGPLSPVERHEREESGDEREKRVLPEVGRRLEAASLPQAHEREATVTKLAGMLVGRRATSVLLVGEAGCGKTAVVQQLCREAGRHGLGGRAVWLLTGSRVVAGMTGFGDWQERCRKIVAEAKEDEALLFFGNLFELLQVGQSACSSESVGSFFRGALVRGELLAVAECTPRQLALIEQFEPRMLDAFRQFEVEPSTSAETRAILAKHAAAKAKPGPELSPEAVDRVLALHQRYAGYSALPGKAVRFVDRVFEERDDASEPVTSAEVDRGFRAETGLPAVLIDEAAALDLAAVEAWFRERIVGQDEAVKLVVDAIAAIKTRVTRPGKPLASFFFAGPTGVGKTELAKTLAEFFYGSKERMIRLDMSEFSAPDSAGRLAAAERHDEEGILTAQARDSPFSVVLLDEFEKAHASVHDLFLQVLGEARLTDGAGRLADFSNAIVILTSNLGAREFRATRPGFHDPAVGAELVAAAHFAEAAKRHFRPEFFNRLDRVVPFLPLSRAAVRAVVRRELALCDGRDGLRNRNLSLVVHDDAVERLAELGYDPRYGARPVKRAIERHLLKALGEFLCARNREVRNGFVEVAGFDSHDVARLAFVPAGESPGAGLRRSGESVRAVGELRRRFQRLDAGSFLSELHSERSRLERRLANRRTATPPELHARCAALAQYLARFEAARDAILAAEEKLLLARVRHEPPAAISAALDGAPGESDFRDLAIEALALTRRAPERIVLAMRVDNAAIWPAVLRVYRQAAEHFGCAWRLGVWRREPPIELRNPVDGHESRPEVVADAKAVAKLVANGPADGEGLALELSGGHAALRFAGEAGLHAWIDEEGEKSMAMLDCYCLGERLEGAWMHIGMVFKRDWSKWPVRRLWDAKARRVRDSVLRSDREEAGKLPWDFTMDSVVELIERAVLREIELGMQS